MKYLHLFTLMGLALSGCSTLDQSIELGSGMGMAIGAGAMVAGSEAAGHSPSMESVAIGAGIGAVSGKWRPVEGRRLPTEPCLRVTYTALQDSLIQVFKLNQCGCC